jgi:hypothetical protein
VGAVVVDVEDETAPSAADTTMWIVFVIVSV